MHRRPLTKSGQKEQLDVLFERLFEEHRQAIFSYLCRLLDDGRRAEEVAQEVFVKAYRSLHRLTEGANYRAWLYRIATNAAYDQLRRRKLIQWLPLLETDGTSVNHDALAHVDEHEAVQHALNQLPPKYRAPLVLYSVQGYSIGEVAEMMGISEGAVKTRLYRAREMFRKSYEQDI